MNEIKALSVDPYPPAEIRKKNLRILMIPLNSLNCDVYFKENGKLCKNPIICGVDLVG